MKNKESKAIAQKLQTIPNGTLAVKHCRSGGTGSTLFGEQFQAVTAGKGCMEAYETFPKIKEMNKLLSAIGRNINQIAKRRKYISTMAPNPERFTRLKPLGADYTEEAVASRIAGGPRPSRQPRQRSGKVILRSMRQLTPQAQSL